VSVPVAPAAGTDVIELVRATEHLTPVGELTEMDDDPQAGARHASAIDPSSMAARGETPAAFGRRCIAALGATPASRHGLLAATDVRSTLPCTACGRALMRVAHQCNRFARLRC